MYDLVYVYELEKDMGETIALVKDDDYIGFWREGPYSFLFYHSPKRALFERLCLAVRSELTIRHEDWESGERLAPFRVGRIGIYQPWNTSPGAPFDIVLDLIRTEGGTIRERLEERLDLVDTFSENFRFTYLFRKKRGGPGPKGADRP